MSKPLNVNGSASKDSIKDSASTKGSSTDVTRSTSSTVAVLNKPDDITSPHELTAYVDNLINQLETRFDDASTQILERMTQMSSRIDNLENAIHDLISGDARPGTPNTPGS